MQGCSSVQERIKYEDFLATQYGFEREIFNTKKFRLFTLRKITKSDKPLTVYIEGDGQPWLSRHRVSTNPTPRNPLALKLAIKDTTPNILYIARPCQFIELNTDINCHSTYWTNKRFSPEVIQSIDEVINAVKQQARIQQIRLVGFSGGGAIATILAAQRDDVVDVRTVAGNLDIDAFTEAHQVSPMTGSINPILYADKLIAVPQIHYIGDKDNVVTEKVINSYLSAIEKYDESLSCVEIKKLGGVAHIEGWEIAWPKLKQIKPVCK